MEGRGDAEGTGGACQECSKNSALFAQFLLTSLTYVLLSYFIHLHCANVHTPLTLLSYLHDTEHQDKVAKSIRAREDL